ncbi:diphthine synthase [Ferroplasma sp.]|uniref:diphthine synthase n=1 Tax=Ferroplasma sp. TaxID=2591003 RepID=UPI0026143AC6|nr:diphthine synthase [Ferroplasma sp.]MCL4453090.1 diphthine synthase [Candidatus Thermoplasmatota archaeon]
MLNIMGLGLRGIKSITVEELEILQKSDMVYFETYTSVSPETTFNSLRTLCRGTLAEANREFIETGTEILREAKNKNVTLLVTGDALSATTHNEIRLEAEKLGITVNIFENASIITAFISKTGLFNYRFGNIVSMPFVYENFFPVSVYDKIYLNYSNNMHTLLLLDLSNGKTMPAYQALLTLEGMEEKRKKGMISDATEVIVGIGIASGNEKIINSSIGDIIRTKPEGSPASIIIPANLNDKEREFLDVFSSREL